MAGLDPLGRKPLDAIMKLKQALAAVIMASPMDDVPGVNAHYSNEQRQNSGGRHLRNIPNAEKLLINLVCRREHISRRAKRGIEVKGCIYDGRASSSAAVGLNNIKVFPKYYQRGNKKKISISQRQQVE